MKLEEEKIQGLVEELIKESDPDRVMEIFQRIAYMVPNDMDLGSLIRSIIHRYVSEVRVY